MYFNKYRWTYNNVCEVPAFENRAFISGKESAKIIRWVSTGIGFVRFCIRIHLLPPCINFFGAVLVATCRDVTAVLSTLAKAIPHPY